MSEPTSGAPDREWRFFLDDMITCTEKVIAYIGELDQAGFEADGKSYDAAVRNLELIGEAATHIPRSVRDAAASIP